MRMKQWFVALGLGAVLLGAPAAQAQDKVLRVATFGGPFSEVLKKYTAERFTRATGVKVEFVFGVPGTFLSQLIAARGRTAPFDVVVLDDSNQGEAARAGVLAKVDESIVTNLKHLYPEAISKAGYGPAFCSVTTGLSYNKIKFKEAGIPEPTSWNDLWDPRLAGKVTLPSPNNISGRGLLQKIAKLSGSPEDYTGAIEKVAQIKYASIYEATTTIMSQLASGDVWVSPVPNGRGWGSIDEGAPLGFVLPREGGIGSLDTIDVVAGTTLPKEAQTFVNMLLDPIAQLGMATDLFYGPTNRLLEPMLAAYPSFSQKFPASGDELRKLDMPDWTYFNQNRRAIIDTWNRRVVH
jgi:putative spermidine/putrescine transport system substrate-binding protein